MANVKYRWIGERIIANSVETDCGYRSACWCWIGKRHSNGYPLVTLRVPEKEHPVNRRAHRVSFEAFKRKLRVNETVDHKCVIKTCVNPEHLQAVRMKTNIALKHIRRRRAKRLRARSDVGKGALYA